MKKYQNMCNCPVCTPEKYSHITTDYCYDFEDEHEINYMCNYKKFIENLKFKTTFNITNEDDLVIKLFFIDDFEVIAYYDDLNKAGYKPIV